MRNNATRWVDCDEVLFKLNEPCLKFHDHKINGIPATKEDMTDYILPNLPKFNISMTDAHERYESFLRMAGPHDMPPVDWAREQLQKLLQQGDRLIVITARKEIFEALTAAQINAYYPDMFEEIVFANHYAANHKSKLEICKEKDITHFIEDNLSQDIINIANSWIKVHLLDQPRNRHYNPEIHKNIFKFKTREKFNPKG